MTEIIGERRADRDMIREVFFRCRCPTLRIETRAAQLSRKIGHAQFGLDCLWIEIRLNLPDARRAAGPTAAGKDFPMYREQRDQRAGRDEARQADADHRDVEADPIEWSV